MSNRRVKLIQATVGLALLVVVGCNVNNPKPAPTYYPNPTPTMEADKFGVKELHSSPYGAMTWVSRWDKSREFTGADPDDPWFSGTHGEGSYRVGNGQLAISGETPRMYVSDPDQERQWRDVEITMYFKRVSDTNIPYAGMEAVARTNHDLEDSQPCDTRGIDARLRNDGHVDFEKETKHPYSQSLHDNTVFDGGLPKDRWIGYKFLVYDKSDGVHLEVWMDLENGQDGGNWVRLQRMVDDGHQFGKVPCAPGIDPQLALTRSGSRAGSESGKPNLNVYFRSDGIDDDGLLYKWGSVREILPE